MSLAKLARMVGTTVAIGIILGILTTLTGLFGDVHWYRGASLGGFVSATSCMGLWAYLTLNFIMRGFVSFRIWVAMQILILCLVIWDLSYFRFMFSAQGQGTPLPYIAYALWPLAVSVVGAVLKVRQSGWRAFVPALFYLYVFTAVEWIPGLHSTDLHVTTQMGIILLGCNTYLLLAIGKYIERPSAT